MRLQSRWKPEARILSEDWPKEESTTVVKWYGGPLPATGLLASLPEKITETVFI